MLSMPRTRAYGLSMPFEAVCGKRHGETICGASVIPINRQLPIATLTIAEKTVEALVDSGSSHSLLSRGLLKYCRNNECVVSEREYETNIKCLNGGLVKSVGKVLIRVMLEKRTHIVEFLVMDSDEVEFDVVLGIDFLRCVGRIRTQIGNESVSVTVLPLCNSVRSNASVVGESTPNELAIDDVDFSARFVDGVWVVRWKWKDGEPSGMTSGVACYKINDSDREEFDKEINNWIEEGILVEGSFPDSQIIPLMAVRQQSKSKVRPVMDYRQLNQHVSCHTSNSAVCDESLRRFRQMGEKAVLLDLRKAYLQLRVEPDMHRFQVIEWKGKRYALTRIGFGLSSAPRIMTKILLQHDQRESETNQGGCQITCRNLSGGSVIFS